MTASGARSDLQRYFVIELSSGIHSGGRVKEIADSPLNDNSANPPKDKKAKAALLCVRAIKSHPAPDCGTSKNESVYRFLNSKPPGKTTDSARWSGQTSKTVSCSSALRACSRVAESFRPLAGAF